PASGARVPASREGTRGAARVGGAVPSAAATSVPIVLRLDACICVGTERGERLAYRTRSERSIFRILSVDACRWKCTATYARARKDRNSLLRCKQTSSLCDRCVTVC